MSTTIWNLSKMSGILNIVKILNTLCKRHLSYIKLPSEIIISTSKNMIVCWHPTHEFPYKYSLPLPNEVQISSKSVLCINEVCKHKREEVIIQEICKMTYTTKHRWYPRKRHYRSRKIEPDRPYL